MPKNILQDVIASRRKGGFIANAEMSNAAGGPYAEESSVKKYILWLIVAALVVFLLFSFAVIFSGATITVTPRHQDVSLNATFSAHKRALDNQTTLPFDIMNIEEIAEKTVPATGSETIHEKAYGDIIIYNNYSSQSQKLIKNTRFETPDGKIFRIQKSITVPGKTGAGANAAPGSVVTTVYANEEGPAFNVGLVDFTIPGLKGSPMYSGFYARSKTPMAGGFSGVRKIVSETDRQAAETELKKIAQDKLMQRVNQEKPEGFILYEDGVSVDFINESDKVVASSVAASNNTATMRVRAVLHSIIFNKQDLSRHIAEKAIDNFDGSAVTISNLDTLHFTLLNKENTPFTDVESISFMLAGPTSVVWVVDENGLKDKLAGTPKSEFQKIMGGFLNIERAEVSIKPFWKTNFPVNGDTIKITVIKPAS
ncbi:MAG: hypothetical protein HYT28_03470 [Parcubacteria group bacterium]|nr:hypothetical protein [Parcubacteria group bacterium]